MKRAIALPLLLGCVAFGIVFASLPHRSSDALTSRVLSRLDQLHLRGSVMHVNGTTVRAICHASRKGAERVELSDGNRVAVVNTQILPLDTRRLADATVVTPELVAEVDLAGPRLLYRRELASRLLATGSITWPGPKLHGVATYGVQLSGDGPLVALIVSRETLRPLAVRFVSAGVRGTATLIRGTPGC